MIALLVHSRTFLLRKAIAKYSEHLSHHFGLEDASFTGDLETVLDKLMALQERL